MNEERQPENDDAAVNGEKQQASKAVLDYLVYGLSIPERAIRGTSGIVGGAIRESANLILPSTFRNSRSYRSFVDQMLEFMINDVAGVPEQASADPQVENYVARKSVSSFIDLAGMATLHVSPLTVMAIVSDLAHGSNVYMKELSAELKKEGVIAEDSTIDSTADLLSAISSATGETADALDTPPISVDGLKETIAQTKSAVSEIDAKGVIPLGEIERTWSEMKGMATEQDVSLFQLSSAMTMFTLDRFSAATTGALSTIRVTGNMFERHVFDHYRASLAQISDRGIYRVMADSSKPYVDAVWTNFSGERATITEDIVSGKLLGKAVTGIGRWLGVASNKEETTEDVAAGSDSEPSVPKKKTISHQSSKPLSMA